MNTAARTLKRSFRIALVIAALGCSATWAYMSPYPKGRFSSSVFPNVTTTKGIQFGATTNPLAGNAPITLYFDLYEPAGDTCTARPCIVCMYGGGFTGGDRSGEAGDATAYAQYGYVAACPDYRKWGVENDSTHKIWPAGFVVTAQDARACVRYLRAHASTYKIDTSRIAIAGCSSGAFITLNTAFMDQSSKLPSVVDTNKFGGMIAKYDTLHVNARVCAAAGNSGAMLDTNWIEATSPPYMGFQSTPDAWGVPTDTGTPVQHWGPYFTYYGITPISARLSHLGLLEGTVNAAPNQHCPGGFADASRMFFYNAMYEIGRKSNANTNVALNKNATQSSTSGSQSASRAVDGNTDGNAANNSVSVTNSSAGAWWQVDLGALYIIDSIRAYNRTDCCANKDTCYDINFGIDGTNWETAAYEPRIMKTPSKYSFRGGILGRYVRIQLRGTNSLQLAEVQVFGRDTNNVTATLPSIPPAYGSLRSAAHPAVFFVKANLGSFAVPANLAQTTAPIALYDLSGRLVLRAGLVNGHLNPSRTQALGNGIYVVRLGIDR